MNTLKEYVMKNIQYQICEVKRGNFEAIANVYSALPYCDGVYKKQIAASLASALEDISVNEICELDILTRRYIVGYDRNISELFCEDISAKEKCAILKIASFDPNGHIRQHAVEMLADYPEAISYIALRTNDWVESVRKSALLSLEKVLSRVSDEVLLKALPMYEKLSRSSRNKYQFVLGMLRESVSNRPVFADKGLLSDEIIGKRFCLMNLFDAEGKTELILQLFSQEKEPFIRCLYLDLLKPYMTVELAQRMMRDRYPKIKTKALEYLYENSPEEALAQAKGDLLTSKTAGVFKKWQNVCCTVG